MDWKTAQPGRHGGDRQRPAVEAPRREQGNLDLLTKSFSSLGQRTVQPGSELDARSGIRAKVAFAVDQDRRNPIEEKLLDEPHRDRCLAASGGSQKGRMAG